MVVENTKVIASVGLVYVDVVASLQKLAIFEVANENLLIDILKDTDTQRNIFSSTHLQNFPVVLAGMFSNLDFFYTSD